MPTEFDEAYKAHHGRHAFAKLRAQLIGQCHTMGAYPDDMGFANLDTGPDKRRGAANYATEDLFLIVHGAEELRSLRAALGLQSICSLCSTSSGDPNSGT